MPSIFPRQRVQDTEQYHRIHPAGNRYQKALPRPDEPMREDALLNVIKQVAHTGMLFPKPADARRIERAVSQMHRLHAAETHFIHLGQMSPPQTPRRATANLSPTCGVMTI